MTSSNELADIHEVFQFYDTRGDGKVTVGQIGSCLRALGLTPTQADVVSLTQQWTDIGMIYMNYVFEQYNLGEFQVLVCWRKLARKSPNYSFLLLQNSISVLFLTSYMFIVNLFSMQKCPN